MRVAAHDPPCVDDADLPEQFRRDPPPLGPANPVPASTVEALCAATKAGTGCGSCKSELAQILTAHAPPAAKVAAAN